MITAFWWCLFLYLVLGVAYVALARRPGPAVGTVLWKVGVCVALGFGTTYLIKLLFVRLAWSIWQHAYYLSFLLPLALSGAWLYVVLPRETSNLVRSTNRSPTLVLCASLAVLAFAAVVCASGADFALEVFGRITDASWRNRTILASALAANAFILFSAYALTFAVTARVTAALVVVTPPYIALVVASLAKLKYMHTAVQPLDLLRIPEFLPFFRSFFGLPVVIATVGGIALWCASLVVAHRSAATSISATRRWSVGLASFSVLLAAVLAFSTWRSSPSLGAFLKSIGVVRRQWQDQAKRTGILLSFLSELPSVFVAKPAGYSAATARRALTRYWNPRGERGTSHAAAPRRVNVVIYLIESMIDPDDLGVRYTSDPMPNLRALREQYIGGHAIVPGGFGESANTEFELLTGMAMALLPDGSLPFRQYLRRPIPSLPRLFKDLGYTTTAIQPDPKYFYNRVRAYALLGFDSVVWLTEVSGVDQGPRFPWPSDRAVVDAVIQASRGSRPFFVFAFPSSTHTPYNSGVYRDSGVGVLTDIPADTAGEIKEYINALHVADRALGRLIAHFRARRDSTVIMVLGDHLPPLTATALRPFYNQLSALPEAERQERVHRVPLLVWANFSLAPEAPMLNVSALPSYLLDKIAMPAPGFLAATDTVRRRLPILTRRYARGAAGELWSRDSMPGALQSLVDDYRLLQYDLLLGKQYSLVNGAPERLPESGK
jgi:hypothetical protein